MLIRVGLENEIKGRSLAWALDLPGCFAYGADGSEALLKLPRALLAYQDWINRHMGRAALDLGDFDLRLLETFDDYMVDEDFQLASDGYEVNAWFRDDWRPLEEDEVLQGVELLAWSRADLLKTVVGLTDDQLDETRLGERWSVRGILAHVASAEGWYLGRFHPDGPRADLPEDVFERLAAVREKLAAVLPAMAGQKWVTGVDGEFWSPRKLIRRALWHELDHIGHIQRLTGQGKAE